MNSHELKIKNFAPFESASKMSLLNLPFDTPQDLAIEMRDRYFRQFYLLPYNRFKAESSNHWWISPTPEKIAFAYGKLVFCTSEQWVPDGQIFCGFNIEKGLVKSGPHVADKDMGNPTAVTQPDWLWHQFIQLTPGDLTSMIANADQKTELETRMMVECGPLIQDAPWDHVEFKTDGNSLELDRYVSRNESLSPLSQLDNIHSLHAELVNLSGAGNGWNWIDLMIGSFFRLNPAGADDTESCAAMLSTWHAWLRNGEETE